MLDQVAHLKRKLVFISQDYSFNPTLAVRRAYSYARFVRAQKCIPLSPILLFHGVADNDNDYHQIIQDCFTLIERADEVWEFDQDQQGHGRFLERQYAKADNKIIVTIPLDTLTLLRKESDLAEG